jgi:AcrR family transcriptional regulator
MPAAQALTRREREQTRHRREVLEAALTLFAQQGYDATSMQEIAQAAEFGVGTLYRLFPGGKEELYLALKQRVVAAFEQELAFALRGLDDPCQQLKAYLRASAQVYASHPREMALYLRETIGLSFDLARGLPPDLATRYRACTDKARQALAAGMAQGHFRPQAPDDAVLFVRVVINVYLAQWLFNQGQTSLDQSLATIEQALFQGLGQPPPAA